MNRMNRSGSSPREASVLVPVYRMDDGDIMLVLVRRTDMGPHGGQISFPGGTKELGDRTSEETALREAHEEIGIDIERVEILSPLPVVETITTGFRISPFLARVDPETEWRREEREIAEILFVRLSDISRPESHGEMEVHTSTELGTFRTPFYHLGSYRLWGATYRILHPLLPRLLAGEWTF